MVIRLQESIGKLEAKLAKAQAAGRASDVATLEQTLVTQREWLAQAENG